MIPIHIFNSLKEGDTLYIISYYPKHNVKKIKVWTANQYRILTRHGYFYNSMDNERLYLNKKDCYIDHLKHLQKIKSDIANKRLEKFNKFIKNNVEHFI